MTAPTTGASTGTGAPTRNRGIGGRHHLGLVAAAATLLASAPLFTLYEQWTWLARATVAVAMIAAAAAAARTLRAPVWAQTGAMLGALMLALTWQFGSGQEWLLLPTPATFEHFGALLDEVPNTIASEAIPVPDRAGLLLLTTIGVGLVAIMVDLAAVGMRRPAIAGLPMLAIYSVPVAVKADAVPAYAFLIGVLGYLWLVATDNLDRVRGFGRRFTGDGRDVETWEPSPMAAAGRRLTVIGALIAVTLPLAVPGMTTGLIDRFDNGIGGAGTGGSGDGTSVNLFAMLDGLLNREVTEDLVRLTTDDPDPHYLRIGVADQITEQGFGPHPPGGEPVTQPLPPSRIPTGPGVVRNRHHAEVEILNWNMNRAPTFAELAGISGLGEQWRYDPDQQVVFASDNRTSGTYEFDYVRAEFDPQALRRARPLPDDDPVQERFAEVIDEPRISDLVARLTEGRTSPYDQVRAIHDYFSRTNGFRYSLETGSEVTGSAIVDFTIENKAGYCVQYASAMAWLVRDAGLPARVAIGFTKGRREDANTYLLTNHNLHAWTEVYFDGFGWVPFDPTPSSSIPGSAERDWAPDPDAPRPGASSDPGTGAEGRPGESTAAPTEDPLAGVDDLTTAPGGGPLGSDRSTWPLWLAGAMALLLALLTLPALRRVLLRRRRMPGRTLPVETAAAEPAPGVVTGGDPGAAARRRAHAAWDELLDTMIDFQVPLRPAETPRVTAQRLVEEFRLGGRSGAGQSPPPEGRSSPAADGARLLGYAEERACYAPVPLRPDGLVAALRSVRQAVTQQASLRTRLRAELLPPSTVLSWRSAVSEAAGRAAAGLGRLGEALARLSPRRWLMSR